MPPLIIKNAVVTINAVDLSDHFTKVTIASAFDDVDLTTFGSNYKVHGQGLGDATITLSAIQDLAVGELDATLWPLSQSGATFPILVRATSAARSTSNPEWSLTGILLNYNPLDAQIGAASTTDITIPNASQTGLQRLTS